MDTPSEPERNEMLPVQGGFLYQGIKINERGEMLSLTDMWKAAGADPSQQPAEWLRSAEAVRFIEFIAENLNLGISQVLQTKPGRNGGTWAHWQPAMAYAKYLSPAFHAACNVIVRAHMEGKQPEAVGTTSSPRLAWSAFKVFQEAAATFGLDGQQALLSANNATRKRTGVDFMAELDVKYIEAPRQEQYLTPTQIGEKIGLSPQKTNVLLIDRDLQRRDEVTGKYVPTERGKLYARFFDTQKKQGGTPVTHLKWAESVIETLMGEKL